MNTTVTYSHLDHIDLWAVALVTAMLVLLPGMLLASLWRLWHGRWPQFGLRAVFVAMTFSAAPHIYFAMRTSLPTTSTSAGRRDNHRLQNDLQMPQRICWLWLPGAVG